VALSHDDYKRLIVTCEVSQEIPSDNFAQAKELRSKWFQYAHMHRFGCLPIDCPECKDEFATQRALNCDEVGNPLDGGMFA
jgi:hypothetical protein